MSDWNLMPGADWALAQQERAHDAYDAALGTAWERLADFGPDGVGWEVTSDEQNRSEAVTSARRMGFRRKGQGPWYCARCWDEKIEAEVATAINARRR